MIVVSNTSPLTNLAAIGLFHLLQNLYGRINIPDGVWDELNAYNQAWPGSSEVATAEWVERLAPKNQQMIIALRRDLDRGEAETIVLALELGADLVLLDERDGRYAAQRLGLKVVGVLGILLEAKSKGFIKHIKPPLDGLRQQAGFYISETLYQHVLALAGE
ncbi:MAG: DUF3368 domain-containing protein [Candidatus Promineifilaceae bacterium]